MIINFYGNYFAEDKLEFKKVQEEDLRKISKYLDTNSDNLTNIIFEVFDTREGKQEVDPHHSISRASARFSKMTIYRVWLSTDDPHFPHEITHLVAHSWSKPYTFYTELDTWDNKKIKKKIEMVSTSFMQEGLAIAVDDVVFDRQLMEEGQYKYVDEWCIEQIDHIPKLSQCLNLEGFSSFDNKIVVPFSASFSKFLLIKFGLARYKQMYISIKETLSSDQNIKIIEDIYQLKESDLFRNWKNSLFL